MMRRRTRTRLLVASASILVGLGVVARLVVTGVLWPARLFAAGYDVRGIDISSYQGDVDWDVLASEDIDFDDRPWTLRQYSDRDGLSGYAGVEQYIDMNVFRGTRDELAALAG